MTKPNKSAKLEYFNNLKLDKDNDLFWEKCNPYFTNKYIKMIKQILILWQTRKVELLLKNKDAADI